MPVVPITKGPRGPQGPKGEAAAPPPPEAFQLMAAAQMHAEGRLVKKDDGQ